MRNKLNQILKKWPAGTVTTQSWLAEQGVSPQLTRRYRTSGWIERVGRGAYVRAGDHVKWKGAVYGLQHHAHLEIWPGGRTALALYGHAQYLSMAKETISLFAAPGTRLPAWVGQHDWGVHITCNAPRLFEPVDDNRETSSHFDISAGHFEGMLLKVSSMERASLEMLYLVRDEVAFVAASEIFQGLVNLRPQVMQLYLEACRSVKVKRLALFFGDYYSQPWYSKLNTELVNVGAGKRQIVKGGILNETFQITVPAEFTHGS
jgi:hypothetical protein